ncbi:NADP-binding protein [Dacryopinax primogenitus]|uniref:NADP-binding protein n=1 Tax=Dacryopinax primogenitus (strain DJM 731) TaxID=1858805 RepID=M5GAK2_DACPD|nr:NADP-binding protein [Dacryopinax primogenitus]EJU05884.1 NADP-binding protein [Dacryopinax primogenitus]
MAPTVYLVSGTNRGIGLALVTQLATLPETIVFAGTRDPASAKDLHALQSKYPDKVHIVKLTSANKEDNAAAVANIEEVAGRLDVVIANAGISNALYTPLEVPMEAMKEHYEVNVLGPLVLFQNVYPLLQKSTSKPKFAVVSSYVGSIAGGTMVRANSTAYGTSKAAVNWLSAKLYHEYPDLISISFHPGLVDTDMSAYAIARSPEMAHIPMITSEECAKGILNVLETAEKREGEGPKFTNWDGSMSPW